MKERLTLLGISASPRKSGNSAFLLDEGLRAAGSFIEAEIATERFELAGKRMSPCLACYGCIDAKGECIVRDDFQPLRDAWLRADAILYVVPVFAMGLPAQLKSFLDRLANSLVFREDESNKKLKVVGTVAQGMHFAAGQESVIRELSTISMLLGCLPLAGESYHGVRGWTYQKLSRSTYQKAQAAGDEPTATLIRETGDLTRDLLTVALLVRSGARVHRPWIQSVPAYRSVFRHLEG